MKTTLTLIAFGILCFSVKAQIPNNGFETLNTDNNISQWSKTFLTVIIIDSTGSHGDSIVFDSPNNALYLPTTDAHSGQYALEMRNAFNFTSNSGIAGGAHLSAEESYSIGFEAPIPCSPILPEAFSFYYKYFPLATDSAQAVVNLFDVDGIQVGEALVTLGGTVSNYTFVSTPIVYSDLRPVESFSISFATSSYGNQPTFGTRFMVDDVSFDGSLGLDELESSLSVFPNPANSSFEINGLTGNESIGISDLNGRVLESTGEENQTINCSTWSNGIYLLKVSDANGTSIKKFLVAHE